MGSINNMFNIFIYLILDLRFFIFCINSCPYTPFSIKKKKKTINIFNNAYLLIINNISIHKIILFWLRIDWEQRIIPLERQCCNTVGE